MIYKLDGVLYTAMCTIRFIECLKLKGVS